MACRHGKAIDERCGDCAKVEVAVDAPDTIYGWSWSYVNRLLDMGCACGEGSISDCPVHVTGPRVKRAPSRPDTTLRRALSLVRRMRAA